MFPREPCQLQGNISAGLIYFIKLGEQQLSIWLKSLDGILDLVDIPFLLTQGVND